MHRTVACVALAFVLGCGTDEITTPPSPAGGFALVPLNGLSDAIVAGDQAANPTFSFGDLKASRDFYFILENTTEEAVTGITLSTSDPAFTVTPEAIDTRPRRMV